jgi:ATP-binding cassette subfamily B protein
VKKLVSLSSFLKPYWRQSVGALVFVVGNVAIDLSIPRLIQRVIDDGIAENNLKLVLNTTLIMVVFSILSAIFAIVMNYLSVASGEGFARDLREALFLKIQGFSYGNLDKIHTGQLMVRLTSDVNMLQRIVRMMVRIGTRAPLLMIGSLILMFSTNVRLGLYILPILILIGGVIVLFANRMGTMYMTVQQKLDLLNSVLQENIAGIRVVKAFVRDKFEAHRFEESNHAYTRQSISVMKLMATMWPSLMGLVNLGIVLIVWIGGWQVITGGFSVGEIVAFTNYLVTSMSPLMFMVMVSQVLAAGTASAERVREILDEEIEVQDAGDAVNLLPESGTRIAFEDVKFFYTGQQEEVVLDGISFAAQPGETVAVLGATGAGKSTLVNLIPRFYDVAGGGIRINNHDVRALRQDDVLSLVGMVPQDTVLFSGSVRDNIAYGRPDASEEDIVAAAKVAQAHDFILKLADGYDTQVNQRGVNLSGGQKQRIAIARAILTNPKILILDDSTSSVDVATEKKIQDALDEVLVESTRFVVAQRISTVLNADKILVIDQGRLMAEGTHMELMETSEIYKEIYDSQLGAGLDLEKV